MRKMILVLVGLVLGAPAFAQTAPLKGTAVERAANVGACQGINLYAVSPIFSGGQLVGHTTPLYLTDPEKARICGDRIGGGGKPADATM